MSYHEHIVETWQQPSKLYTSAHLQEQLSCGVHTDGVELLPHATENIWLHRLYLHLLNLYSLHRDKG